MSSVLLRRAYYDTVVRLYPSFYYVISKTAVICINFWTQAGG